MRRLAALAASAGFLAACGGLSNPLGGDSAARVADPAPAPAAAPSRAEPPVAMVLPPPAPPKRLATADLVGRSSTDINRLFGQPRLLRREAPAEVWQFPGGTCTLLVFLYPEDTNRAPGPLRVQHADAVPTSRGAKVVNEDCVESLLKDKSVPLS